MKIQIGRSYISRDKKTFAITKALQPNDFGYEEGYRFEGETSRSDNRLGQFVHIALFKPDGVHASKGTLSTPTDLVKEEITDPSRIPANAILAGDVVRTVAEAEGDVITDITLGWESYGSFEIPYEMFQGIFSKLPRIAPAVNYECYAVSTTVNTEDVISSILVIFKKTGKYYCSMLFAPGFINSSKEGEINRG